MHVVPGRCTAFPSPMAHPMAPLPPFRLTFQAMHEMGLGAVLEVLRHAYMIVIINFLKIAVMQLAGPPSSLSRPCTRWALALR